MHANATANRPLIAWTSQEGKALIRNLVTQLIPQWPEGPREHQVSSWARTLARQAQFSFVATGGGKTSLFYGPVLIADYLSKYPVDGFLPLPASPIAVVVVPLIELGNNHVML